MSTRLTASTLSALAVLALSACAKADKPAAVRLDYATYNPVSLLLKEKRFLEEELAKDGVKVEWTKSAGSNKALELLSSGSVDFGSTAGAAALIARANGNPIRTVAVYSKPEWTALVVPKDSPLQSVADLRGKKIAVTRGTDPFVFLLRALDQAGLTDKDVEIVPLQHQDGKLALERGDVQAWSGLDPLMATEEVERGARLLYRNPEWNTYGVLNASEAFLARYPAYVPRVLAAYEKARQHALAHPAELRAALAAEARLSDEIAGRVLARTELPDPAVGEAQRKAIAAAGDVLRKTAVVKPETDVAAVVDALLGGAHAVAAR